MPQQVVKRLNNLQKTVDNLKMEVSKIKEMVEDSILTEEEAKLLEASLHKIKSGDTSDFVPLEKVKKALRA